MKTFFCYLFLLQLLDFQPQGRYERHNQFCGGMDGADMNWSLDIKTNYIYTLSITKKTNNYLQKPKKTSITGTWKKEGDTLRLYQWGNVDKTLMFYQQDDKLIFQKRKLSFEESDLLYLDYLQKTGK